ncbi:hypothetical protein C8A05DRAFT_15683 [Staphylotrichum tortipilum]|uniref:Cellobiose dehydrogenase-like cytochrome domain-containing protein n=1 Tax=Staphylotrichum tortipilum TaxID=2831512 RepID=A0AAN6MJW4_9PEZI|nr:hypothetical protein C8A05DRAFT_15683 [Staphylotrichum longicolle]
MYQHSLLLLSAVPLLPRTTGAIETSSSTDANTALTFTGHAISAGYLFGMITPENPTTDFIAQIISPLTNNGGWGGISFGASMVGPMLIATWPNGAQITTSPRTAHGYTPSSVTPYTTHPITLLPIPSGSYINATHISSMFLCRGCINADTFSPAWANDTTTKRDVFFAYAFSQTAVDRPGDVDTPLSAHTGPGGGYGAFRVDLEAVRSAEYEKLAAMAGGEETGGETGTGSGGGGATTTKTAATPEVTSVCVEEECQMPNGLDDSHRVMGGGEVVALVLVGVAYLAQAFLY